MNGRSALHSVTGPPEEQVIASVADPASRIGSGRFDAVRALFDIRAFPPASCA